MAFVCFLFNPWSSTVLNLHNNVNGSWFTTWNCQQKVKPKVKQRLMQTPPSKSPVASNYLDQGRTQHCCNVNVYTSILNIIRNYSLCGAYCVVSFKQMVLVKLSTVRKHILCMLFISTTPVQTFSFILTACIM